MAREAVRVMRFEIEIIDRGGKVRQRPLVTARKIEGYPPGHEISFDEAVNLEDGETFRFSERGINEFQKLKRGRG